MNTMETIDAYFAALAQGSGWVDWLAETMEFTSHGTPVKHLTGRDAYVESTRPFYSMIRSFDVNDVVVDGDRACAFVTYRLEAPDGREFVCEVAERFEVSGGRIGCFSIYFDATPFPG